MAKGRRSGGGPGNMMAQLQRMQEALQQAQTELAEETVEASAGGGAVKVVMTGAQECRLVEISPELLQEGDAELLQDLVVLAVNQAIEDSQAMAAEKLGPLTGGLSIPGLG